MRKSRRHPRRRSLDCEAAALAERHEAAVGDRGIAGCGVRVGSGGGVAGQGGARPGGRGRVGGSARRREAPGARAGPAAAAGCRTERAGRHHRHHEQGREGLGEGHCSDSGARARCVPGAQGRGGGAAGRGARRGVGRGGAWGRRAARHPRRAVSAHTVSSAWARRAGPPPSAYAVPPAPAASPLRRAARSRRAGRRGGRLGPRGGSPARRRAAPASRRGRAGAPRGAVRESTGTITVDLARCHPNPRPPPSDMSGSGPRERAPHLYGCAESRMTAWGWWNESSLAERRERARVPADEGVSRTLASEWACRRAPPHPRGAFEAPDRW
jgi:hypothetical protein